MTRQRILNSMQQVCAPMLVALHKLIMALWSVSCIREDGTCRLQQCRAGAVQLMFRLRQYSSCSDCELSVLS